MSFANTLDVLINDFCDKLAIKFNLDRQQVREVWSTKSQTPSQSVAHSPTHSPVRVADTSDTEITREKILSGSKDMLVAMCKKAGVKVTGKKEELMQRLTEFLANKNDKNDKKAELKPEKKTEKSDQPVIRTIKERTAELAIRKNKFGNFEHSQTGLVFNTENKMVYGRQVDDAVVDLTVEDIELCKKYKFPYKIPENLNTTKNLDDIKIEDLEEEVLDEDDLEDEGEDEVEDDIPDDE
jgi:hypothetical protein